MLPSPRNHQLQHISTAGTAAAPPPAASAAPAAAGGGGLSGVQRQHRRGHGGGIRPPMPPPPHMPPRAVGGGGGGMGGGGTDHQLLPMSPEFVQLQLLPLHQNTLHPSQMTPSLPPAVGVGGGAPPPPQYGRPTIDYDQPIEGHVFSLYPFPGSADMSSSGAPLPEGERERFTQIQPVVAVPSGRTACEFWPAPARKPARRGVLPKHTPTVDLHEDPTPAPISS